MDNDNVVIGNRIKQRRKQLNMTLEEVAVKVGVTKPTIQRYETGSIKSPKIPVLHSIANVLCVNPLWLVNKSDVMEKQQSDQINTIAAHHDGNDWTEEELEEIENFKKYVVSKRDQK